MGWIESYILYTQAHEAPEIFHRWSAIGGIAATLNRKCFMWRADESGIKYKSYPGQIMIVSVADSGKLRKSTQLGFIREIIDLSESVNLYKGKFSPEELLASLSKNPNGAIITIVADELSYFFGKQKYAEGMIENVIELSGAPDKTVYKTRQNNNELFNACLTMIMCTTPQSLALSVPSHFHGSGLMSRYIWIYGNQARGANPMFDRVKDTDKSERAVNAAKLRQELVSGLKKMATLKGEFDATDDARTWFKDWYMDYMASPESEGEGWPSRVHENIVRVGMTICASEKYKLEAPPKQIMMIETEHLQRAHAWVTELEKDFNKAFAFIGGSQNIERHKKLLKLFNKEGIEITEREIMRQMLHQYRSLKELKDDLMLLKEAGMLAHGTVNINASKNTVTVTWIRT